MRSSLAYRETYSDIHGLIPPAAIRWGDSEADVISPGHGFMGAFDLTMQLHVGCPAG